VLLTGVSVRLSARYLRLKERPTMTADVRDLDRRAVAASVEVVSRVTADDLGRPTPCSEWTLGQLLTHMTAQHLGFAAAAAGHGADPDAWKAAPLAGEPVLEYAAAADAVIAAFAEPSVLERRFQLPEIMPGMAFPAGQAISFHFIDYVVHGWDVARALGVSYELDAELAEAGLPVAQAVPCGASRLRPGAAFRPVLDAPAEADPLDRILTLLGRSPDWQGSAN
jgi:uncharacterized protein (TIGR03086 family)